MQGGIQDERIMSSNILRPEEPILHGIGFGVVGIVTI